MHSIARSSLGKLRNNLCLLWRFSCSESVRPTFGRQILGKALEFPGKRLQKSLPECCFTLDTDFDWLRQKNKPRMANFPIENIAHERCNVLSHCKNGISQLSRRFLTLFCKLIVLVTRECLRTKKSISNLALELCLEFQGKYFDHF